MSVDIETTRKTWSDAPEPIRKVLGEAIDAIQHELMVRFDVLGVEEEVDDINDNGFFPIIDLEVHVEGDPDGSTRRLVVSDEEYFNLNQ
tara:strand:+ start:713 stop:979 length:267 start_codon:yes stop_codon:yes gene_type:complete